MRRYIGYNVLLVAIFTSIQFFAQDQNNDDVFPIDELTALRIANFSVQIAQIETEKRLVDEKISKLELEKKLLDERIARFNDIVSREYGSFLSKNGLKGDEWEFDGTQMVLRKKQKDDKVKSP